MADLFGPNGQPVRSGAEVIADLTAGKLERMWREFRATTLKGLTLPPELEETIRQSFFTGAWVFKEFVVKTDRLSNNAALRLMSDLHNELKHEVAKWRKTGKPWWENITPV
jgi:hypothetical protein